MSAEIAPLDAFLDQYRRDREAGQTRPLRDYLDLFPDDDEAIVREYLALRDPALESLREAGLEVTPASTTTVGVIAPRRECVHPAALAPGTKVGDYAICRVLGAGGMGIAYLAEETRLQRYVVLKTVRPDLAQVSPGTYERLLREAQLASKLDHPGICRVNTIVDSRELGFFVVLQFIPGVPLSCGVGDSVDFHMTPSDSTRRLPGQLSAWTGDETSKEPESTASPEATASGAVRKSEQRTRIERILGLMERVAAAVQVAHDAGITHRDLKPQNIMLRPDGQPVVLDFGLACARNDVVATGEPEGTPQYMAPEQVMGGPVDARTDVYGLGVILYELLSRRRPFSAKSRKELYGRICAGGATPLRRVNPAVSRDLEAVVHRAMSKEPRARYDSAADLAADLARCRLGLPTLTRALSPLERFARAIRRHPARSLTAAAVLALAVTLGLVWIARRDARETTRLYEFYVAYHEEVGVLAAKNRVSFDAEQIARLRPLANADPNALRLLESPTDNKTQERFRDHLASRPRGGNLNSSRCRPFGTIESQRPTFVWQLPPGLSTPSASETPPRPELPPTLELCVQPASDGRAVSSPMLFPLSKLDVRLELVPIVGREPLGTDPGIRSTPDARPTWLLHFALGANHDFDVGDYEWAVRNASTTDSPWGDHETPRVCFRVAASGTLARIRTEIPDLKDLALRQWLEASALFDAGYYQEASETLDRSGGTRSSQLPLHLAARVLLLRGAIDEALGERNAFDRATRELRTLSRPAGPPSIGASPGPLPGDSR